MGIVVHNFSFIIFVASRDHRVFSQSLHGRASSFFPKEPAGPFMPAKHAMDANTNMAVTNATEVTQLASAVPTAQTTPSLASQSVQSPKEYLTSPSVTPVKLTRLRAYLQGYDQTLSDFLLSGFRFGFSIPFFGDRSSFESPNLKSALDNPHAVRAKLNKELAAGRIVGPFLYLPFATFRTSPLGVVPKKHPSEFRLIRHLSYPCGASINDFIPKELSTVRYASINDAISIIKNLGVNTTLLLQNAFCIIFLIKLA